MLKQRDQTKQQAQQSGQQLRVSIAKLFSLKPGNKRLDLCGVSRIVVWIFLHRRRRRFYPARRSEARASGLFFDYVTPFYCKRTSYRIINRISLTCSPSGSVSAGINLRLDHSDRETDLSADLRP